VRWPPACEDVSPGAEERSQWEDFAKQRSEDHDGEHFIIVRCKDQSRVVLKCPINPITNPNAVYTQSRDIILPWVVY
jgi:hypothetical protein